MTRFWPFKPRHRHAWVFSSAFMSGFTALGTCSTCGESDLFF